MIIYFFLKFAVILALKDDNIVHDDTIQDWIVFSLSSIGIVFFAGIMSGLTVGMLSLDELDLHIKLENGTEIEKAQAKKILPVISKHHLLLVTLLLANAAAMETLPLLLDRMFNSYIAILLSVTFVLIFGEIVPQAFCTGPDQLRIASNLVNLVKVIMVIFFPLSFPIAKFLDWVLGKNHEKKFQKSDLKTLVSLHEQKDCSNKSGLGEGQVNIIHGAIDLQKELVKNHMIDISKVYMLESDMILNKEILSEITEKGFSRVPIYNDGNKNNIAGILHIKKLVTIEEGTYLNNPRIKLRPPVYVHPNLSLLDLLAIFQEGKGHIALVNESSEELDTNKFPILGIITLEDVMELLLKTEIMDEDDYDTKSKISYNKIR